jgi:hypothetical protein
VVPTAAGVAYEIENVGGSVLRMQINSQAGGSWCAPIVGNSGFISGSQFNTACWDNSGTFYNLEPLTSLAIVVPGSDTQTIPFDFCLTSIAPSDG